MSAKIDENSLPLNHRIELIDSAGKLLEKKKNNETDAAKASANNVTWLIRREN
jgi:hypothetical protein